MKQAITYLEAISAYVTSDASGSLRGRYERVLIWLATINEMLPCGKKLSGIEIQKLAYILARKIE